MAKIAPVHISTTLLVSNGRLSAHSTGDTDARQSTTVALYTFTHAFLI
jgi:hypothetical protein